jgi:addiction module RelB/DinJ family antitoxin
MLLTQNKRGGIMAAVQVSTRIDESVRDKASNIFSAYGLDIPTALRIFISTAVKEQRFPLDISKRTVSLNGDEFESDQKYFEQIPGFLQKLDKISESKEWYSAEELGWKL